MIEAKTYEVPCPYVMEPFNRYDEDGPYTVLTWRPGVVFESSGPEDVEAVAHGMGSVSYTVVEYHRLPRPYPARVFFTRQWIDPDGRKFGRKALRIMTEDAFRRRLAGYRAAGTEDMPLAVRPLTAEEIEAMKSS